MLNGAYPLTVVRRTGLVVCLGGGLWDAPLLGGAGGPVAGGLHALAIILLASFTALVVGRRLVGTRRRVEWIAASAIVGLCLAQGLFHLLAGLHLFTRGWALTAWTVLAIGAGIWGDRDHATIPRVLSTLRLTAFLLARLARGRCALFFWIPVTLILANLLRALGTPPLNWDALTYHLFKAGLWVQTGGTGLPAAPDAWSYYAFFPGGGEVLSAWAMLPFHGDLAVNAVNLPLLGLVGAGFVLLARQLGVGRERAAVGATVLVLVPSIFFELRTVLVDIGFLAEVLCGLHFVLRARATGRPADAVLAALALGLALATKSAALPIAGAIALASAGRLARRPLAALALLALLALPAAPWTLRAWQAGGSPLYPLPVRIAGLALADGSQAFRRLTDGANEQLDHLLAGDPAARDHYRQVFGSPFTTRWRHEARLFSLHATTPGPVILLALLLAPLGVIATWRRGRRGPLAVILLVLAFLLASYLAPDLRGMRFWWIAVTGRFLAPAMAILLILAIAWPPPASRAGRVVAILLALASLASCGVDIPLDWYGLAGRPPLGLIVLLGATAAGCCLLLVLCRLLARSRSRRRVLALLAGLMVAGLVSLPAVARYRADNRYIAYATRRDQESTWYRNGIPAWSACDEPGRSHRIACAAGYDGVGHNWFWYPLLGRDLQNDVTYIPITRDGRLVDYAQTAAIDLVASKQVWLERLIRARIDRLVTFPPPPIETRWAQASPECFLPIVQRRGTRVWEFDREAALKLLQRQRREIER